MLTYYKPELLATIPTRLLNHTRSSSVLWYMIELNSWAGNGQIFLFSFGFYKEVH